MLILFQGNFFLVFRILTTSLGADNLLGTVGKILGVVFEWLYLATLLTCFVLALGNRPQGSNKFYMTMVCFWVFIMIYLSFAAVFVAVKSIQHEVQDGEFNISTIFSNKVFFSMIVSLMSTYVLWLVASFLFFDPWHMFTCVSSLTPLAPKTLR
jgi:chitin synthase